MTIKKKLYISFSLTLLIMVFIIGIFFYTILHLNTISKLQTERYEQIRKVEKLKEYKNAISWVALDIFIDKGNNEIVLKKTKRLNKLFENVFLLQNPLVSKSESLEEQKSISLIFEYFTQIESLIQNSLANNDFEQFNNNFMPIRTKTTTLIIKNIDRLQKKLNDTEKTKSNFIFMIEIELIVLLVAAFLLSFMISTRVVKDIQTMLRKLNNGILQLLNNKEQKIQIDLSRNNELNQITENFNRYLQYKDEIISSREELLRNISHELKTPIAKGKFLVEKLKNHEMAKNINDVFYDIEELTSKLLQRERLNFIQLEHSTFKVTTLILEALSKLSLDESKIQIDVEDDFEIEGDLYYLTMALKNLLENALKYSIEFPIKIETKSKTLFIKNEAIQLQHSLNYYIQPFTREANQQQGYGLGLNIVHKIVQIHHFQFLYKYQKPYNIFSIHFSK